ncbi:hypothetical protein ALE3EI_1883 [Constantimarinum furrinae]|uniref:Uncharacterized protein n=1 Tax=Constantimarinum furrinae TaxID=2562285 RepID=A0A7G8PVR4_9FLAO|nr:hypothetical protein ALE3EI_1883 [Constantimarinum furrinae]
MSTLVSLLLAAILNMISVQTYSEEINQASITEINCCKYQVHTRNACLINQDEQLF